MSLHQRDGVGAAQAASHGSDARRALRPRSSSTRKTGARTGAGTGIAQRVPCMVIVVPPSMPAAAGARGCRARGREMGDHYVIDPVHAVWGRRPESGAALPEDFSYHSLDNPHYLGVEEIRRLLVSIGELAAEQAGTPGAEPLVPELARA